MSKRVVTVIGATGMQGGSVVNALLADGTFAVRGITHKPSDPKSLALAKRGVEIVQGDIMGPSENLVEAFKGSYGLFIMTAFPPTHPNEKDIGIKLVDAAQKAGVKHLIWSSLANVTKISGGKYRVPHFTAKAEVEEYVRALQSKSPKAFENVTFAAPAFFFQNFDGFFQPRLEGDTWVFTLPTFRYLIAFDVTEMGPAVVTALKNPAKYNLKRIDYYGEMAPPEDYVKTYEKVTGKKSRLNSITFDEYAKLGFPGAEEISQMFAYFDEFNYYGPDADPKSGQEATPNGLSNYETYLRRQAQLSSEQGQFPEQ
jgi:uncharacterized protein YbjT (DUF2867 family)